MVHRLQLTSNCPELTDIYPVSASDLSTLEGTILQANQTTELITPHQLITARWGLIPPSARNDYQSINRLSAEAKSMGYSSTYRIPSRKNRAILPIASYLYTHQDKGQHQLNIVRKKDHAPWMVPVIYDFWMDNHQQQIVSFAIIHHSIKHNNRTIKLPFLLKNKEQASRWFDMDFKPRDIMQWQPNFKDFQLNTEKAKKVLKEQPTNFSIPGHRSIA